MVDVVLAIQSHAGWLYVLLAVLVLREIAAFRHASRDRATALFGLEHEAATGRLIRSAVTMLLLGTIGVGIFMVARVVAPTIPELARRAPSRAPLIVTPPTAAIATDTPTPLPATATRPLPLIVTATPAP
ncbi:hypothetical protein DCC79_08810 [bacterium]|nr:hypothetical protein [Chloroflexi bacterium CFX6]RIL10173.1 MAG: hypothetical protein DCC79_08810 [bacterium]